jgi:glucosamine kinase
MDFQLSNPLLFGFLQFKPEASVCFFDGHCDHRHQNDNSVILLNPHFPGCTLHTEGEYLSDRVSTKEFVSLIYQKSFMLLIADSGSTKTDWRLVDEQGRTIATVITEGLNPYFYSSGEIAAAIREKVLPLVADVEKVFFYGAGCGLPVKAEQVRKVLDDTVRARYSAEVSGDILGAARSLLQDDAGIACILGTGANSCVYDGRYITDRMPSLGFMFSDWGSGTVMSKDLIALLLQEKLPRVILEDFRDTYQMDTARILDQIYNQPLPNRFLASFTPFLLKYAEVPECNTIILDNFHKFFTYYVMRYPDDKQQHKICFTGSVAFGFKPYLLLVAEQMGVGIETIVQHPMDGLVKYHCITVPVNNSISLL